MNYHKSADPSTDFCRLVLQNKAFLLKKPFRSYVRGFSTQANYYSSAHKWHRSRKNSKSHQHAPQRKSSNFPFPLLGASLIEVSFSLICSEAFRRNSTTCAFHTRKHAIFSTKRLTLSRTRAKKQSRSTAFAIPCGLFDAV